MKASASSTAEPKTKAVAATVATAGVGKFGWWPLLWSTAWPLPRVISQRLTGKATAPATTSANDSAPQNRRSPTPACIAPGTLSMIALSTISMTAMLNVSVASAIGTTALSARPGAQQRQAGQRVAEQERERDGERDRAPLREPERGPDHHAHDLADRAPCEAVQRRAQSDRVERAAGRRQLVVMMVVSVG